MKQKKLIISSFNNLLILLFCNPLNKFRLLKAISLTYFVPWTLCSFNKKKLPIRTLFICWDWDFEVSWFTFDCCLESMVIISGVVNDASVTIRVDQWVLTFNCAVHSFLRLTFNVSSVFIMNFITEFIVCWRFRFFMFPCWWTSYDSANEK